MSLMSLIFSILVLCNFGSGAEYHTDGPSVTYDGHFYSEGVLHSIESLNVGFSIDGDFVSSGFTLKFHDSVFDIRGRNEEDLHNSIISIYLWDGTTATKITDGYVSRIGYSEKYAILKCSTENTSFYKYFLYSVNRDEFPACPESSIGQTINYLVAETSDTIGGEPTLGKAYQVDLTASKEFIYAKLPTHGDAAGTKLGQVDRVWDGAAEITGTIAIVTDTVTIEGIEYKRGFIDCILGYTPTNNPLTFTSSADLAEFDRLPEQIIKQYDDINYNATNITNLRNFMEKRIYFEDLGATDFLEVGAIYTVNVTGVKLLEDFCKSFLLSYIIVNNELHFKWIDYPAIEGGEIGTFDQTILDTSGYETDTDWVVNKITANYHHDSQGGMLRKAEYVFLDGVESRSQYGTKHEQLDLPFCGYNASTVEGWHSRITSKHYAILHSKPITRVKAYGSMTNTGMIYPGDIIKYKNPDLKTPDSYRHYLAENVGCNLDRGNYEINVDLIDIEHLKDLDHSCYFLLHSWVDGSTEFWNDAAGFDCFIDPYNSIDHAAVVGSLNGCMIEGDGVNKYLQVRTTTYITQYWDILQYADYTIFCEIKMNSIPGSGTQSILTVSQAATDLWEILLNFNNQRIIFKVTAGGAVVMSAFTADNTYTDTSLHQIACVKVGNDFGVYFDGTQVAYSTYAGTDSILGTLSIFQDGFGGQFLDGFLSEIYLAASNIFDAAPVVGLTDTIAVKTNPFNWYGLNE